MLYIIYKITNKINGRFYIGSTIHEENRKSQHWSKLARGYHHNKELQEDYNKYGRGAFEYEEIIQTYQKVMEFFITFQYVNNPLLYNDKAGDVVIKDHHNCKSVVDLDTQTKYKSISSASRLTGANSGNIIKCCKKQYKGTICSVGIKHRFVLYEDLIKNPYLLPEATDYECLIFLLEENL